MKAYVINLDSRPDRLASFQRNKIPFEVERFPGVVTTCGEDGCTLSHIAILKTQKVFPFAVFEDDCVLIEDWSIVERAMDQLPKDWDALWLGATLRIPLVRYSENLYRLRRAHTTHAIIYNTRRIVKDVLERYESFKGSNIDIYYCRMLQKKFNCYITYPMVATQLSDYSDIAKVHTDNHNHILHQYKRYAR